MINRVILLGNLTRDPELKYTAKGTAVAETGMAMNEVWHDDSGDKHEEVTFVDVTAWGSTAETLSKFFKKGSEAAIEGRLKLETWDDKQTGQKRSKLRVTIDRLSFTGGTTRTAKGDDAEEARHAPSRGRGTQPSQTASNKAEKAPPLRRPAPPDPYLGVDDDDIPF